MICCLTVHGKTWDVCGKGIWVVSMKAKKTFNSAPRGKFFKALSWLLHICRTEQYPTIVVTAIWRGKRQNSLVHSECFYTAFFLQFQGENIPLSCLPISEINLLVFFYWLNSFISKIFSSWISSLVNTYDAIPLTVFVYFSCTKILTEHL